jgi:hypothetical protein
MFQRVPSFVKNGLSHVCHFLLFLRNSFALQRVMNHVWDVVAEYRFSIKPI